MNNLESPCSLRQNVSIQQVGTETLVYDEQRHLAFCLNHSSSVLWRLANGQHTIEQMRAAAELELKTPITEEFVLFALAELRRDGLMEPSRTSVIRPSISRRVLLQKIGVGSAILLPTIAAIVAPTAAQAYNGCVDCTISSPGLSPLVQSTQTTRAAQIARLRRQQQMNNSSSFDPFAEGRPYAPYTPPKTSNAPVSQDTAP